ncbi:hypothetical protein SAMN03159496_05146 [Rhizobium sp. NFR07]|uniref:hypothetical protein n=1 Tax=Rhizobium sp. NFR07 TaxID=1566262 RepID=UPI0008EFB438|nr:hypothetical protein [Rhizobium sp. NFR07]SFB56326.1 hypothetical protein SAMN03159496_05146 [Rhizobium sp. NFR07]
MAGQFEPGRMTFSQMDIPERDAVLQKFSKSLRYKAMASRAASYPRWKDMEVLDEVIERDHTTIAADLDGAAVTVIEAVRLLSEVEREYSETRH